MRGPRCKTSYLFHWLKCFLLQIAYWHDIMFYKSIKNEMLKNSMSLPDHRVFKKNDICLVDRGVGLFENALKSKYIGSQ